MIKKIEVEIKHTPKYVQIIANVYKKCQAKFKIGICKIFSICLIKYINCTVHELKIGCLIISLFDCLFVYLFSCLFVYSFVYLFINYLFNCLLETFQLSRSKNI